MCQRVKSVAGPTADKACEKLPLSAGEKSQRLRAGAAVAAGDCTIWSGEDGVSNPAPAMPGRGAQLQLRHPHPVLRQPTKHSRARVPPPRRGRSKPTDPAGRRVAPSPRSGGFLAAPYKTAWAGGTLVVADRYYPSSKSCSACGTVKAKLSLAERTYTCGHCGLVADRDITAARNLAQLYPCGKREAQASHATSTRVAASGAETSRKAGAALAAPSPGQQNARGGAGSGRAAIRRTDTVRPAPANREADRPRQGRRTGTAASAAAA